MTIEPATQQVPRFLPLFAIALAIRAGTVIYAEDSVLEVAGITIPDEQESEVERFREFLDQISPEDFETGTPE